jgi:hypothetical protein
MNILFYASSYFVIPFPRPYHQHTHPPTPDFYGAHTSSIPISRPVLPATPLYYRSFALVPMDRWDFIAPGNCQDRREYFLTDEIELYSIPRAGLYENDHPVTAFGDNGSLSLTNHRIIWRSAVVSATLSLSLIHTTSFKVLSINGITARFGMIN